MLVKLPCLSHSKIISRFNQVWFITFPIDFAKDSEKHKHDPKLAKLEIAKNRSGEKGVVDLQFEKEYTLFTDYDYSRLNPAIRNGGADKDGFFPVDNFNN
jgi:hypothetical protein